MSVASAAVINQPAYDLEQHYLGISKILADEHEKSACGGDIEVYTANVVDSVRKAREYFDYNYDWNKAYGRLFTIDPVVTHSLATTLALKDIMHMLDFNKPQTIAHALNRVIMWGPAPGAYGNMTYLQFGQNGKLVFAELVFDNNGDYYWVYSGGSFAVRYNVDITIDVTVGGSTRSYYLKKDFHTNMWNMVPVVNPVANPYFEGFVDYPSECEA